MALTVQNLRAVGTGVEPASLLPGQIAFNITDKVIYVGDGSSFKTDFEGNQVSGVPGEGWYAMPMDFDSLGSYYVANPSVYGDTPTDQQVLTWSTALNHPIWTSGGGGGGNQVYVVTNAQVAGATGATTSDKITNAIGVASPDEGDVTIVTGLPNDVYEGLYFFTTSWIKGAAYAYPSAAEVIYDNTVTGLTPTVQGAIDDLDAGLAATTAIANTANSNASSALSIANAALPKAGGTMTGVLNTVNVNVQSGHSIGFNGGANGNLDGVTDSTSVTSSTVAASATAVKNAYDLAAGALSRTGGTMSGAITFAAGQVFPISGIQIASISQLGVVQVGTNINVTGGGTISVNSASTSTPGIVQLTDSTTTTSSVLALTATAGASLQSQINSLTVASNTKLAGSLDCASGLVDSVTTDGIAAGFAVGSLPPSPAAGNANYYLIVTVGSASYSPPGGGGPYAPQNGDWFLSNGTSWQYLGVGSRPAYASTTTAGIVQLATNSDTQAGVNATLAVTPAGLQSKVSDSTSTVSSTTIASSTAVKSAYDLGFAALPKAGGTMTGDITFSGASNGVVFNDASTVEAISDSVATTSSVTAASSTAVKSAYDLGAAALPKAGGTMTGAITFAAGQTFPISGIQDATTGQKGVVQIGTNIQVSSGTISVNTATAGQLGLVQVGTNIDVASGTISVKSATTGQAGVVQLNDTVASTSTTQALTANQGKLLQDQINALSVSSNITFAGTINGSTGNVATVTTEGAAVGFTVGSPLPAPSATIAEFFVIVSTAGTMTPPGGSPTAVQVGDWWLASASTWTYVAAGYTPVAASTTTAGIVQLATNAETQAGVNSAKAVVPSALQSKLSDSTSTTSSTTIASSTAVKSAYDLANAAVPKACYTALGSLVAGTGSGTIGTLSSSGTNGQVLAINNACSTGMQWCTLSLACVPCSAFTAPAQLLVGTGASTYTALAPVSNGQVLVSNSACASGLQWISGGGVSLCGFTCTATPFNTAIGSNAGGAITTATQNTFLGFNAGSLTNTGGNNTFIGYNAGCANTGGSTNIAVGTGALSGVTTGTSNIGIGFNAGAATGIATHNVIIGCGAGAATTGSFNILIGGIAGQNVTTGTCNIAIGYATMQAAMTGTQNIAIGRAAGCSLTSASCSTLIGHNAGGLVTTSCNTALGWCALSAVSTQSFNTAIGLGAIQSGNTANSVTAVGHTAAQVTTSTGVVAVGRSTLQNNTSGVNTAVGYFALNQHITATGSTAVGFQAGCAASGGGHTLIGNNSGCAITTGTNNTIIGPYTGTTTLANNVVLADGSANIRFQANSSGAWSPDGTNYGTAGQVLMSNGNAAIPTWTTPNTIGSYVTCTCTTTSTTPYVIATIPIGNGAAFAGGQFTAVNATQGKIWTIVANAVAQGATVDKNLGNSLASIGGTTRAATIDFVISGSNLQAVVTPNFADSTTVVFTFQRVAT